MADLTSIGSDAAPFEKVVPERAFAWEVSGVTHAGRLREIRSGRISVFAAYVVKTEIRPERISWYAF